MLKKEHHLLVKLLFILTKLKTEGSLERVSSLVSVWDEYSEPSQDMAKEDCVLFGIHAELGRVQPTFATLSLCNDKMLYLDVHTIQDNTLAASY